MNPYVKRGISLMWSLEQEAWYRAMTDPRYARIVKERREIPPTAEEVAKHARATELLAELEQNPYFDYGYDGASILELRPTIEIDYAETREEWIERVKGLVVADHAALVEREEQEAVARKERFDEFAAQLGIKLFPWQVDCADALLRGEHVEVGRRWGRRTVLNTVERFLTHEANHPHRGAKK